ncbi:hypothetical protein [Streptomyces sp. H27-D2]|uniref:hypothetical protein n=1 Tax=Streptomyces sp. H27-D2 TaxID=3046304 RepID=UPI002DB6BDB8|nr:hypothetical protein [Streptomyces sp. H27-D2]MEC4017306.1 hypothetical protein [Streptomyces sp. H27-D2]
MVTVSPYDPYEPSSEGPAGPDRALGPPTTFDQELCDLVLDTAPRLFAVVQEYDLEPGERDAHIAAWGMAHDDGRVQVVSVGGGRRLSLGSAERAVWWFGRRAGVRARLVWLVASRGAALDRAGVA